MDITGSQSRDQASNNIALLFLERRLTILVSLPAARALIASQAGIKLAADLYRRCRWLPCPFDDWADPEWEWCWVDIQGHLERMASTGDECRLQIINADMGRQEVGSLGL